MSTSSQQVSSDLLTAILPHVAFDGWTERSFQAALDDLGLDRTIADLQCPRGAVDLAVAYHKQGDQQMRERAAAEDLSALRYSQKVAILIRYRLEAAEDKEAVRRGTTLFALPPYALDGARLIWDTADAIWTCLGDTSEDINWYSKRATLSAVYSSTVLFWLGDTSPDHEDTWAFLDRRIADVMSFEKVKGHINDTALLKPLLAGPKWALSLLKAPGPRQDNALPGQLRKQQS